MPAIARPLAWAVAKGLAQEVGVARSDVQQVLPARSLVVRRRGLKQVPGTVQLVVILEVAETLVGGVHLVPRIQVSIRALGRGQPGNDRIQPLVQVWVRIGRERIRNSFERLV